MDARAWMQSEVTPQSRPYLRIAKQHLGRLAQYQEALYGVCSKFPMVDIYRKLNIEILLKQYRQQFGFELLMAAPMTSQP